MPHLCEGPVSPVSLFRFTAPSSVQTRTCEEPRGNTFRSFRLYQSWACRKSLETNMMKSKIFLSVALRMYFSCENFEKKSQKLKGILEALDLDDPGSNFLMVFEEHDDDQPPIEQKLLDSNIPT